MRRPKNTTLRKRSSMDERAGVKVKHRALELREKCDMSSGWASKSAAVNTSEYSRPVEDT
jgi:hypothetical protein